jgi:hypothetical protein
MEISQESGTLTFDGITLFDGTSYIYIYKPAAATTIVLSPGVPIPVKEKWVIGFTVTVGVAGNARVRALVFEEDAY